MRAPLDLERLLQPLTGSDPCGRSLDRTPLLAIIERTRVFGRLQPLDRPDEARPIDWISLRGVAFDALGESKDLRVLAHLAAALLRTEGIDAFFETLSVAAHWLETYWADVYPRLDDGDATARQSALACFADPMAVVERLSRHDKLPQPGGISAETTALQRLAFWDAVSAVKRIEEAMRSRAGAEALPRLNTLRAMLGEMSSIALAHPSAAPRAEPRDRVQALVDMTWSPPAAEAPAPPAQPKSRPVVINVLKRGISYSLKRTREAPRVECHVMADMDPEVVVDRTATIEVTVSREQLAALAGRTSAASGPVTVDASSALLVQVMPKTNFVLAAPTQDRARIAAPAPGSPVLLYFDVTAAHPGPGEIWIVVRQHQMGIARLVLKPTVVERLSGEATPRVTAEAEATGAPPLARPLDQVSIFEQTIGDTVKYVFEMELPSLNVFGLYESAPLTGRRDAFVGALYKEIEDRYVSTLDAATRASDVAAFTAELQAYGATLFDQLFPREMQELLWTHRDAIRSVRVVSTEPFIPWEIVHLREPGRPLDAGGPSRFLGQMGLVRWLYNVNGLPPTALKVREGRARFVIPTYPDPAWALPSTATERHYLEQVFGATPIEPQPNPVREALAQPGSFDLLHFACHGEADSQSIAQARIVLEGRMEGAFVPTYLNPATVETFGRLKADDGAQPIVFVNACQAGRAGYQLTGIGGFAQAFLRAGGGAFVGTLWSVGDEPAFFFGKAFYDALNAGDTVAEAAIKAREAARRDDATWLAYVVYGHPHATMTR